MTQETKVVVLPEAREEAYRMGYDRFKDSDIEDTEDFDLSPYHGSAEYCNNVLPTLRCMAGNADRGKGTYTEFQEVVTVEFPEDRPMDGKLIESHYILDELVKAFNTGIYDAIDGLEYLERLEF